MTEGLQGWYVSVAWTSPFRTMPGVHARGSDRDLTRVQAYRQMVRAAWQLSRRDADLLVITAGAEVVLLCAFRLVLRRRRRLAVYDFLAPRSRPVHLLGRLVLRRVDRWIVVRRGDTAMLGRRYRVPPAACKFVPFPAARPEQPATLGDYVYSAGRVHRDWPTLLSALERVPCPAIVCAQPPVRTANPRVSARALPTATEGRALAAGARLVVVSMVDTELPAGPVVLVDAMAAGKAVVASDVNGTRDYIRHGVDGWLVPPGDADALARQLAEVLGDDELLTTVGRAAAGATLTAEQSFALVLLAAMQPGQ